MFLALPTRPHPRPSGEARQLGGKVVAWLTTSSLSSEIRTPLGGRSSPGDGVGGEGKVKQERGGRTGGRERGEPGLIKWEEMAGDKKKKR